MTGFQPTPAGPVLADGSRAAERVSITNLVRACNVNFVRVADPYDYAGFRSVLSEAYHHTQAADGGLAVVIAERSCVLDDPASLREHPMPVLITPECDGCRFCLESFGCPALVLRPDGSRVDIDNGLCVACGQCVDACHKGYIVPDTVGTGSAAR